MKYKDQNIPGIPFLQLPVECVLICYRKAKLFFTFLSFAIESGRVCNCANSSSPNTWSGANSSWLLLATFSTYAHSFFQAKEFVSCTLFFIAEMWVFIFCETKLR